MLYHISDESDIELFRPRPPAAYPGMSPVVWALDEAHLINYLFPRECPRIIYALSDGVSDVDRERFFSYTTAKTVIAVESGWYERINQARLYQYAFDLVEFECFDETAGYYISKNTVKPQFVEAIDDLLHKITASGAELRVTPNLHLLRDAVLSSTVDDFSIIRFRNAAAHS
ncbi:DUF6886 family protein [Paenibacillus radicis (ex Gao et al. 2016)]|uniref:Uncharacterized protein n=1 Tax=Paenibacillus radicis (ex Gao et al. 2016) TaxID=1737354 RepID=A0A917M507_9BACL|nr:DUF6886 family protein [Paenibacillus radicis (ex Gao et al. 2016)]GGG77356.1 hypothetical protein GCM10010918_37550 [Paenibacillus radicis (ex Gao et al. 2016)]